MIVLDSNLVIPRNGVYITKVEISGENTERIGITNVGCKPTFGSNPISIETHIIDYNKQIYGKEITIRFFHRIRGEVAFKDVFELSKQIETDKISAINYFN
jgi:riboflavin kinase/FMN adenylyltransferase